MADVDKAAINAAVQQLVKAYNNPSQRQVEKAIALLKGSISAKTREVHAIRATEAKITKERFLPLGVKWMDEWLRGGVRLGEFILWVDVPGGSKTHMLKWFGSQSILQGYDVLDISGEDLIGDTLGYYQTGIKNKNAMRNLWIADMDAAFGVDDVASVIEQVKKDRRDSQRPLIVVLDHIDLMQLPYAPTEASSLKHLTTDLKFLAKHEKVVLFSASQALFTAPGGQRGMGRIYGSKVGKAGNMDVIFIVDDSDGQTYKVTLAKARGRKRTEEKQRMLETNWDRMEVYLQ